MPLQSTLYSPLLDSLTLTCEREAYNFSHEVKLIAIELGFDSFKACQISLGVSEIAINAIKYAKGVTAYVHLTSNKKGLKVHINDTGSGIRNLKLAMQTGFSSSNNSLGLGLPAAKRSVDLMNIDTSNSGTQVTLTSYLPIPPYELDIASVSFPEVGKYYNRDCFYIKTYQGDCLIAALFDIKEDKEHIHELQLILKKVIAEYHLLSLEQLLASCFSLLTKQGYVKGMDIGLLRIAPTQTEFLIHGNITIKAEPELIFASTSIQEYSAEFPYTNLAIKSTATPQKYCFYLHTDGITGTKIPTSDTDILCAQKHAEDVFDSNAINNDDATIIVIKSYG